MKTLLKTIALLATFTVAGIAMGATPNDSSSFNTLYVSDVALSNNSWSSSVNLSKNELLSFELHYYLKEGVSAQDMRFSLENLNGRTYKAGESETVTGKITASNLSPAYGSVQVHFTDNVRLDLYNVSWQKYPCSSVGCEESLVDSYAKVLTSSGMSIGNVSGDNSHYTGNIIVSFKVSEYDPTPSYKNCSLDGITVAHGNSYRFYSQETTTDTCSAYSLVRTCTDGVLSGSNSYKYASCTTTSVEDAKVSTLDATNISINSARLRGDLDLNDWSDADAYFVWGSNLDDLTHQTSKIDVSADGIFDRIITGLNENTRYYYRAVAIDDDGDKVYGFIKYFTTLKETSYKNCSLDGITVAHGNSYRFYSQETTTDTCSAYSLVRTCTDGVLSGSNSYKYASCRVDYDDDEIDITTLSATNIDKSSARLRGQMRGDDNTKVWFAFDKDTSTPSCYSSSQRIGRTTVDDGDYFSETVTQLDENKRYYFRACGEDANGDTVSGSIRNFTTDRGDDDEIDITTLSATNIDKSSARLRGQMRGDDNTKVWFAFDKDTSTPSCYSSSQRIGRTTVDDGDYFSETVTQLDENKRYYFRACGEDANGDTVSGSIRNFTTDRGDDDDDDVELRAVTGIASHITTVAARLNAYVFGEGDAYCYFQFGRTSSLGLSTSGQSINLDDTSACSILRNTLSPNTTYYYRVVLKQGTNYEYGSIRNFHTNSVYVPPKPSIPEADDDGEIEVTKWVSAETDPRFDTYTRAQRGETVYYKVRVQNDTGEDLDDLTVIDRIPFYLELDTDRASDDDQAKTIQWVIDLDRGESRTFITEMRVREDARKGDVIISYASASNNKYSANSNDVEIEVEGGLYGVDSNDDANQGATIFGAGFFPQTLVGWGILLIILLIILYIISRIIVSRNEHARTLAELEAARRARNG